MAARGGNPSPAAVTDAFTEFTPAPDHRGTVVGLWTRRAFLTLFSAVLVAALVGLIGQRSSTTTVIGPAATFRLTAPKTVRGGLFYQARAEIVAHEDLKFPSLVVDDGWVEGMQVNSVEPQAPNENALNGKVQFGYGELPADHVLRVWFEFEVNPTNVGKHPYGIQLENGNKLVARIQRTIRVLP
jgi:hypothetical protein